MKNLFRSIMIVAVAAMAFVGCAKDNAEGVVVGKKISVSAVAHAPETRTIIGDITDEGTYPVTWTAEGETLAIFENTDNASASIVKSKAVVANEYTLSNENKVANFTYELTENTTATDFDYYVVYPSTVASSVHTGFVDATIKFPVDQTPTATSADAAASVLFAKSENHASQPASLNLDFAHVAAYAKMTITGLPVEAGTTVEKVTFAATDAKLTGSYFYYWDDNSKNAATNYEDVSGIVNANVRALNIDGSEDFDVWFACMPATVSTSFTVTVTTSEGAFARTVTIPSGRDLSFAAGEISTFKVNMESATSNDFSGSYVVMAKASNVYYALSSEADGTRLANETFGWNGEDKSVVITNASLVWNVTASGAGYLFENGGKYLTLVAGKNQAKTSDTGTVCSIAENSDGTYSVTADDSDTTTRYLARNDSSNFFAFYKSSSNQNQGLYLVPATYKAVPVITLNKELESLSYVAVSDVEIATVADAVSVTVNAYNDEACTEACTWLSGKHSDGTITYSATENEGDARTAYLKIVATNAEGSVNAVVTVEQAIKPVAGEASWHKETWSEFGPVNTTLYTSYTIQGDLGTWSVVGCSAYENANTLVVQNTGCKYVTMSKTDNSAKITSPTFVNGIQGLKFNYYANATTRKFKVVVYENESNVKEISITPASKNELNSYSIDVTTTGSTYITFEPTTNSNRVSIGEIEVKY